MFILYGLLGATGQIQFLDEVYHYRAQLHELRSSQILAVDSDGSVGKAVSWLFMAVRVFLFSGALYFMWSVRHPKPE